MTTNTQISDKRTPIKAIITGVTGMVGEGVLHECLQHPDVAEVLVLGRKPCGIAHPKLKEIVHGDLLNLQPVKAELAGYNACFFCLGVSSVGMQEADYTRITYDLTLHMAGVLAELNPDMAFSYVSGSGTDSTETGRSMWARVKGRTENALLRLPFRKAFMFRPGYIHPTPGLRNTHKYYKALTWLYPPLNKLFPGRLITLRELGFAMIHTVRTNMTSRVLESRDIVRLARER